MVTLIDELYLAERNIEDGATEVSTWIQEEASNFGSPVREEQDGDIGITVINTTEEPDSAEENPSYGNPIEPEDTDDQPLPIDEEPAEDEGPVVEPPPLPTPPPVDTSPKKFRYKVATSSPFFSKEMEGYNLYIPNPENPQPAFFPPGFTINQSSIPYTASIVNVINETTALVNKPYFVMVYENGTVLNGSPYFYSRFGTENSITASYTASAEKRQSQNLMSFTKINLTNLETISGELYKVRVYARSNNYQSSIKNAWRFLGDSIVTENDYLNFLDINNIPYSATSAMITESYQSKTLLLQINNKESESIVYNPSNFIVTSSNQYYFNSTKIVTDSDVNQSPSLFHKVFITQSIDFISEEPYYIQFKLQSEKSGSEIRPYMEVFMSGSAFENNYFDKREGDAKVQGKFIQRFSGVNNFGVMRLVFLPRKTGVGWVNFIIKNGIWHISDIRVSNVKMKGFSSKTYSFLLPTLADQQDDKLDFKIEFFNPEEVKSDYVWYSDEATPIDFSGSNVYINSNRNLIPGSIFIGNVIGEGIEIAGVTGS